MAGAKQDAHRFDGSLAAADTRRDDKQGLFADPLFEGFGRTVLYPERFRRLPGSVTGRGEKLREGIRELAPKAPGIYGMIDSHGRLIYIGKAKRLRVRLLSYFRKQSRDPKAGRIIRQARRIVWETAPNEFLALLRELELIQRFRPKMNVSGQPGLRRYQYLCIGRSPAPTLFVSPRPGPKEEAVFGPFVGAKRLRQTARVLNDQFQLRDCPQKQKMHFADQPTLFPLEHTPGCLRFEIQTCSGPCAGGCSRQAYARQVQHLKRFLQGEPGEFIAKLEEQMQAAASAQAYELAETIKQRWQPLVWLRERLGFLRYARQANSFLYVCPVERHKPNARARNLWIVIDRGLVRQVFYQPVKQQEREKILNSIEAVYRQPVNPDAPEPFDSVLLVHAWFKRYPQEREKLIDWKSLRQIQVSDGK